MISLSGKTPAVLAGELALSQGLGLLLDSMRGRGAGLWVNSSSAASYCMLVTDRSDLEWHSILRENRRSPNDMVVIGKEPKRPRGNAKRLGELPCLKFSGKVYYAVRDLDDWLNRLPTSMTLH